MGIVLTNNIVLLAQEASPVQALTFGYAPRIGWRDIWSTGTVSGSTEAQPAALAVNGLTYDAWRSAPGGTHHLYLDTTQGPIDYVAVAGVVLAGGAIKPQYYNGADWVDCAPGGATPGSGTSPIVWYFPRINATRYRLRIVNAGGAVAIAVVMAGLAMTPDSGIPVGWEPPSINPRNDYSNDISIDGQMLGRQVRRYGASADVTLGGLTYSWVRGEWSDFIVWAERRGFFLWWEYDGMAEVIYGGMTGISGKFTAPEVLETGFRMEGVAV